MATPDKDVDIDLSNPDAVQKYKTSAEIASKAITRLISDCVPGKRILDLCQIGDKVITDEFTLKQTKSKVEKGIAFPTCISVNNCVGHFSPLPGDATVLKEGDLVKIDLGVHLDGFICVVAHTLVATKNKEVPVEGREADVVCAAHFASEAALRLIRPGNKNTQVTDVINKVAKEFHCQLVEGVLSHQMKRFVIDGNKVIISRASADQKVDEFTFEENEVYALDIVMSTGEGKPKESEARTTIYKRAVDSAYNLKLKTSRYVLNEINNRFSSFPFTLRSLDEKRGRLGIVECVKHGLVHPYPVLYEKQGEYVAHFKFTVFCRPNKTSKLTDLQLPFVKSNYMITDPELKEVLDRPTKQSDDQHSSSSSSSSTVTESSNQNTTSDPMETD